MKRTFLLILAVFITASSVLSSLAGCAGEETSVSPDGTVPEAAVIGSPAEGLTASEEDAETERITLDLSGRDYGGYAFRVWNYDNYRDNTWDPDQIPNDLISEGLTGDTLNDAVYTRNRATEEALNIVITGENRNGSELSNGLRQSVVSGSDDVDGIFSRIYEFPTFVNNEYLYDLASVDALRGDVPWRNAEVNRVLTVKGRQFGMVSDITFYDKISTIVTYFNQKLAADYQLGNLYSAVEEDAWTLDALLKMGADVSADVNGDGKYDTNDAYPLSCQNDAVYYFLHGANLHICETDEEGNIVFTLPEEKAVTVLQKIYGIMGDERQFYNRQTFGASLTDAVNMFCENRVMFLVRPIQSLFLMRNMEADFGILPVPKVQENQQSYGSAVNPYSATLLCFPKTVSDPERAGVISDALAWESHDTVIGPLYENILGSKLIRDEGASRMLDIVFDSVVYDLGMIWNFGNVGMNMLTYNSTDVASFLARNAKPVDADIQKLEKVLDNLG